mmetsp:Transcript_10218/g.14956  ORF Transcript_10218/g.14956 Transcript_10218/m.14956 type:complete len:204 (-) Transcript_10218:350-961(-)
MEEPDDLVLRPGRKQRGGEWIRLRRHDGYLNDEHDDETGKRPLSRIAALLAQCEDVGHHAPGEVENTQFHEEGGFIEAFVGVDAVLAELVVHLAEFHVHEDVVGLLDAVEFVRGRGAGVFVGVEREREFFVGAFDGEGVGFSVDAEELIVVYSLCVHGHASLDSSERGKESNGIHDTFLSLKSTRTKNPGSRRVYNEHVKEEA